MNRRPYRLFATLGTLLAVVALQACADPNDATPNTAQTTAPAPASAASKGARAGADPLRTPRPSHKTKIPFQVEGAATAEPGQAVDVEIALTALADARGLTIEFKPGEGLEILAGGEPEHVAVWARGDGALRSLSVVSDQPGTAYVHVHVSGRFEGRDMGGAYAVPITIGGAPAASLKSADTPFELDEEGQLLIQVPGEPR